MNRSFPEGPGTSLLRNQGVKTMIVMAFGAFKFLIMGYLDPLGSVMGRTRRWIPAVNRPELDLYVSPASWHALQPYSYICRNP